MNDIHYLYCRTENKKIGSNFADYEKAVKAAIAHKKANPLHDIRVLTEKKIELD